jgi:hypothetical protein
LRDAGIVDHDRRAFARAEQCDFPSDAASGAGDRDDLAFKSLH